MFRVVSSILIIVLLLTISIPVNATNTVDYTSLSTEELILSHTRTCIVCAWTKTETHRYDTLSNKCIVCGYARGLTPVPST